MQQIPQHQLRREFKRYPWYVILLTLITLGVIYYYFSVNAPTQKTINVPLVKENLNTRHLITEDDFEWQITDASLVPEQIFTKEESPVGYVTITNIPKQTIITESQVASAGNPDSISTSLDNDKIAYRLPKEWLSNGLPQITTNDRLDIIAVTPGEKYEEVGIIIEKALILSTEEKAIILSITHEEAAKILYAQANKISLNALINPLAHD